MGNRKITITVETDSVLLVRRRNSKRVWCRKCANFSDYDSVEDANAMTSADTDILTQLLQSHRLHLINAHNESQFSLSPFNPQKPQRPNVQESDLRKVK